MNKLKTSLQPWKMVTTIAEWKRMNESSNADVVLRKTDEFEYAIYFKGDRCGYVEISVHNKDLEITYMSIFSEKLHGLGIGKEVTKQLIDKFSPDRFFATCVSQQSFMKNYKFFGRFPDSCGYYNEKFTTLDEVMAFLPPKVDDDDLDGINDSDGKHVSIMYNL